MLLILSYYISAKPEGLVSDFSDADAKVVCLYHLTKLYHATKAIVTQHYRVLQ